MLFRIILLAIIVIFMESSKLPKIKDKQKIIITAGLIVIILISGFRELILDRSLIGTDYFQYKASFYNNELFKDYRNIGFNFFMFVIRGVFRTHIAMFLISAAIIILSAYIFGVKNSKNKYLAFYVFITFGMFMPSYNILRQWLACAIFLLAFDKIEKGEFLKYAVYILIATTFHLSALPLILLYPVLRIDKLKKVNCTTKLIVTGGLALIAKFFFSAKFIFKIVSLIDNNYYYRYVVALDKFNQTSNYTNFLVALAFLILLLVVKKIYNKFELSDAKFNYLLLLVIVAFCAPNEIIFSRMLSYFLPALMLAVPSIYEALPDKYKKIYYAFCILFFGVPFIL